MFLGKANNILKVLQKGKEGNKFSFNNNINFVNKRTKFTKRGADFIGGDQFRPDDKFNYKSWYIKKDIEREEKARLGITEEEVTYNAKVFLAKMHLAYPQPKEDLYNRIIKAFVNSHNCRGALYVIDDMKKNGFIPSIESYTVLINALYQNNCDFRGAHFISKEFQTYYPNNRIPHPFGDDMPHPVDVMDYHNMRSEVPPGVAEKFIEERMAKDREKFAGQPSNPFPYNT